MDIQPLTKHQCWLDIGKYFERAKRTPLHDDQYYIDAQQYYGMDESDFFYIILSLDNIQLILNDSVQKKKGILRRR